MKNTPDSLAFVVLNQEANQLCFVLSTAEEGRPIFALGIDCPGSVIKISSLGDMTDLFSSDC